MRHAVALALLAAAVSGCAGSDTRETRSTPAPSAAATKASPSATSSTTSATCSAAEVDPPLPAQPELPAPVGQLRADIDAAAADCDYERLESLALDGDSEFTASFGEPASPADHWRQEEEAGREPMRMLRGVLRLTHAERDGRYVWPAAFARDTWEEVTAQEREELQTLFDERDLRGFEQFGAYVGHRVVTTAAGDWLAFVAGD
jgi:hypothetical protein